MIKIVQIKCAKKTILFITIKLQLKFVTIDLSCVSEIVINLTSAVSYVSGSSFPAGVWKAMIGKKYYKD